jgi:hypothetical protein
MFGHYQYPFQAQLRAVGSNPSIEILRARNGSDKREKTNAWRFLAALRRGAAGATLLAAMGTTMAVSPPFPPPVVAGRRDACGTAVRASFRRANRARGQARLACGAAPGAGTRRERRYSPPAPPLRLLGDSAPCGYRIGTGNVKR